MKIDPAAAARLEAEEKRIANQRNLFTFLPGVPPIEPLPDAYDPVDESELP
jgi:hypothetical protein